MISLTSTLPPIDSIGQSPAISVASSIELVLITWNPLSISIDATWGP